MTFEAKHWAVVANIKKDIPFGHEGQEIKNGVRLFRGGTKVYIIDWFPGMCESIIVIGQHKHSRSFIKCVIRAKAVENLRKKLIYDPKVNQLAENHVLNENGSELSEEHAENIVNVLPTWWEL